MHTQRAREYNYDRFRPAVLGEDVRRIREPAGPMPGEPAPPFALNDTSGREWRLPDLQGRPVVLIAGSGTCPLTAGSLPGLQRLYRDFGDYAQWLMLYVREAHPGEALSGHHSMEQKRTQAERLQQEEGVVWPVLVDELDGRIHEAYGGLPNPVFLIDRAGRIAFRGEMAHAPTLRDALSQLRVQDGLGPVGRARDKGMHMLGATAYGWNAFQRGGRLTRQDAARYAPPLLANLWLGHYMRPLLGPLARRDRRLPRSTRLGLTLGGVAAGLLLLQRLRRHGP